jgi:hypothetical protein
MWAAIVGSVILVGGSVIGYLITSHLGHTQKNAVDAHAKAHSLELTVMEQRASHAEEMRKTQVELLEYKLYVSNEFVRKDDHSDVITEIFRKLDNQNQQQDSSFREIRKWLDSKFENLANQLNSKQDRKTT